MNSVFHSKTRSFPEVFEKTSRNRNFVNNSRKIPFEKRYKVNKDRNDKKLPPEIFEKTKEKSKATSGYLRENSQLKTYKR